MEFTFGNEVPEDGQSFIMGPKHRQGSLVLMLVCPVSEVDFMFRTNKENRRLRFAESVYYADMTRNMLHLAGLLITEEISKLKKTTSLLMLSRENFLYTSWIS